MTTFDMNLATTPAGAVVETPHFEQTLAAFQAVHSRTIVAIDGEPGLGKTFAAMYACAQLTIPVFSCDMTGATTPTSMFQTLYRSITGRWPERLTRAMLEHDISELLTGQRCAVMVDEAQGADRRLLRCVRSIYDKAPPGFMLILVGSGIVRSLESNEAPLRSRVSRIVPFRRLEPKDLVPTLHGYHPMFASTVPTVIARLDEWAQGNFRRWAQILDAALDYELGLDGNGLMPNDADDLLLVINGTIPKRRGQR